MEAENSEAEEATSKYGSCQECKEKMAIHQCPRCELRTCSLECCRGHKERTQCSGKRDRGSFLPLCRMTDSTLRSDYFFLEEVLNQMPRNRKRTKLDPSPAATHHQNNNNKTSTNMSRKARKLVQQADVRGTKLQVMPPMMERHKSNTSWYCAARDMITWKLEVVVYPGEKRISFKLSENEKNLMEHVSKGCEKEGIGLPGADHHLFLKKLPSSSKNPKL